LLVATIGGIVITMPEVESIVGMDEPSSL
jgi:hypothetical protein